MGWIEKLRAELVDLIEWVDDDRHALVWRFPRYHNQIKHGARLVVRPGQLAVFVREGRIADVFGPGLHRLETRNLPVLSTLAGWKHGFDSPFMAEVYFTSSRVITDLRWGTPNPVPMRDPDFGAVRVRAFGTYTLRARDPRTLLERLVGTDGSVEADEVGELLRAIIASSFADLVAKSEIPVLEIASRYAELSEELRRMAMERIGDEYGLEIPQLFIVNVSVPAEVEQALDSRSSMAAIGDLAAYQAYQLGQAMPVAAQSPAGGIAGAGVGLGMGLAMAGPALGAGTPPPPPPAAAWHRVENGRAVGPFGLDALARAAAEGSLTRDTLVWSPGMPGWRPAGEMAALAAILGPPPVPVQ
jgi:membrane protease subunit (stomatin/prohibitin family)